MADETFMENPERRSEETVVEESGGAPSSHTGYVLPPSLIAEGYQVKAWLGDGAEARVWLCSTGGGRDVAVKLYYRRPTYKFEFNSDEYRRHFSVGWAVEVFKRDCDNVAGSEMHYEVMEYCPHGTLEELVAARGRSDELATLIVARLTSCLKSLQGEGATVVHGDLKPRNVLVRDPDRTELVLADFGLTIQLGERSMLSNLGPGTPGYIAPEVVLRKKGAPADWWSLGMVLYTVLVGRGYYQIDDERWATLRAIEDDLISRDISLAEIDNLPFPPERRARWKLLLAGLLTHDRKLRWGAAEVESWLSGGSPDVHRQLDTAHSHAEPSVWPFPFAGVGEFSSAEELGHAMAARPEDAARMLSGKGTDRLVDWLMNDVGTGDDYSELALHSWDPDAKVAYFVARMAPNAALTFRSKPIGTPADLRRLVQNVETDVIDALYVTELLGSLADNDSRARSGYRMIDANWRDLVDCAVDAARTRGISLSDDALRHIRRQALLLAASDATVAERYVADVRERVGSTGLSAANDVDWFARLRRDARL